MLAKYADTNFQAHLYPSKFLTLLALVSYAISILSLFILTFDYAFIWLCIPWVIRAAYQCITRDCLRNSKQSITFCQQIGANQWRLKSRYKTMFVEQCGVYRSRWLIVITFHQKENNQKGAMVLAFDAMDKQSYHQLLARLWKT